MNISASDGAHRETGPSAPGRPRNARADEAIVAATLRLVATHGVMGLNIDAVAAEAGCGKATIYRRWPSKEELVAHALSLGPVPNGDTDTGSTLGDIERYLTGLIDRLPHGRADVIPHLVEARAGNEPIRASLNEYNSRREEPLRQIFERGVARGELSPDLDFDALIDYLVGPVIYRHLYSGRPLDRRFVEGLLELAQMSFQRD